MNADDELLIHPTAIQAFPDIKSPSERSNRFSQMKKQTQYIDRVSQSYGSAQ